MIISFNDIPAMRKAFKRLVMQSVDIAYSVAAGCKVKPTSELIIRSWG